MRSLRAQGGMSGFSIGEGGLVNRGSCDNFIVLSRLLVQLRLRDNEGSASQYVSECTLQH